MLTHSQCLEPPTNLDMAAGNSHFDKIDILKCVQLLSETRESSSWNTEHQVVLRCWHRSGMMLLAEDSHCMNTPEHFGSHKSGCLAHNLLHCSCSTQMEGRTFCLDRMSELSLTVEIAPGKKVDHKCGLDNVDESENVRLLLHLGSRLKAPFIQDAQTTDTILKFGLQPHDGGLKASLVRLTSEESTDILLEDNAYFVA